MCESESQPPRDNKEVLEGLLVGKPNLLRVIYSRNLAQTEDLTKLWNTGLCANTARCQAYSVLPLFATAAPIVSRIILTFNAPQKS